MPQSRGIFTVKIGETYEIRKLSGKKELNGSLVKVVAPSGKNDGRWNVQLKSIQQTNKVQTVRVNEIISVAEDKLFRIIRVGHIMTLKNFDEEDSVLNGRAAKVKKRYEHDSGRWIVQLYDKKTKTCVMYKNNKFLSVFPSNLEHIDEEDVNRKRAPPRRKSSSSSSNPPPPNGTPRTKKKVPTNNNHPNRRPSATKKRPSTTSSTPPKTVKKVPKLSALLAMGGPEAEEYKRQTELAALSTWTNNVDNGRWQIVQESFEGLASFETKAEEEITDVSVDEGIEIFQNNPEKYVAMLYWPYLDQDRFIYILRAGTTNYQPQEVLEDDSGSMVVLQHLYQRLDPFPNDELPAKYRDEFTDDMTFEGKRNHRPNKQNYTPILPGRGMGIGDEANMTFIGDYASPADVFQGSVGDCWLLSAIACLADYDWAVKRLFRKTRQPPSLEHRPIDKANQYIVTLWDLNTWTEVDIMVDERLPVQPDGSGFLLGAKPSKEGCKLWVPYLEKAIALHCGGYDKLVGGKCTDAWPMLTGSRNQFVISKATSGKYMCGAKYDPFKLQWSDHDNSPHDYDQTLWRVNWPIVGGGGEKELELDANELFGRIVMWNDHNYLLGAGTEGSSDKESTDGIVDNHAYSIIDTRQNICDTGIDLLLIRNPWGEGGELKNGKFMRSGPGWDRYPEIEEELNPTMEDNGLCWVTKNEFFRYFPIIYVCALNMTRLQEDSYVSDLADQFERHVKPSKAASRPVRYYNDEDDWQERQNISIDSDKASSKYKVVEQSFNGGFSFNKINKDVVRGTSIDAGVEEFKANPEKYLAIHYQTAMVTEGIPEKMHQFTFIYREGTLDLEVEGVSSEGTRTIFMHVLQ